jgi:hypothetical protein
MIEHDEYVGQILDKLDQVCISDNTIVVYSTDNGYELLFWPEAGYSPFRFGLLVHHTEREWAYDRRSPVGRLDKALDEAGRRGWTVVDMKRDWKTIYPPTQE